MRTSEISRVTAETDIRLSLDLDGRGASDIDTGVGFLDHMLTLLARHARFDLYVKAKGDINKIVSLAPGIKFNLGSHINHSIYWKNLCPIKNGGGALPADSALVKKIEAQWGSFEKFKEDFINQIMKIQGSGWGNLAYNKTTKCLEYLETKDQDPVALKPNYVAILCIDGWEHAWYLQYMNVKKTYYNEIWKIINWKDLEQRYQEAIKN